MRIGIEAERANIAEVTGVEHYAKQLILNLAKIDTENNYILYLRSEPQQWIKNLPQNFSYKVMPFPIFWTQLRISWEMLVAKPDALFIMASALPIIHPKNSVVTIHDLAWDFYPETFGKFMLNYLRFSTWFACKFARKIIAVSEQTKKDLLQKYHLPEDKVIAIHHGFDFATEFPFAIPEEQAKIAQLPEKFILFISTLQPRKNVLGLIDAFLKLKKEKSIPHSLVLAGGKGWLYDQIIEKIEQNKAAGIVYFGYVHDRLAILRKADLLVQPAFYEGFGMTVLDAFATDVPVACSNVSSLPEVAGDAAVYFDPKNSADMANAIYKAISDAQLRANLVSKGRARLKEFSWEKCARETLNVLKGN